MKVNKYGLLFLYKFIGKDSLFVNGRNSWDNSFSSMQDLQQNQRRRFMAEKWGGYEKVSPLQKFLRKKRLVPPSIYINKSVSDAHIFGSLESCLAPNIEFLYQHATNF